ncbi:hypothetical protein C8E03_108129 [Lachnotalea glycerini]|uniref:Uncharacterized protein n=1 Tax=Lachnotalea glycerini TaxID=1763509 RepID=A0A318EQH4_9FIRM|nr:hypothetical protein [Lachnotalea glycerini]OYP08080.1 hypothetical protein CG709_09650 [Lachnotalea glycerini]PXV88402.1 hypothetical protein C8E03_108129 [Lachnotalea glycerini]
MIKEALKYVVGLSVPVVQEIKGQQYSDKQLHRINHNPQASSIQMGTLTSFVDYIRANIDSMSDKMIVHVESPTKVSLYSQLDAEREREYLVNVVARVPEFRFNQFIDHEEFLINLQSKFIDSGDRGLVLKFAGTVEDKSVAEYGDDGVTQKATVKNGIASKTEAIIPNPVNLAPYRTFLEVAQPLSDFVFRMKSERGIQCAIFEADGGAWKNEAMQNIKNYLRDELEDLDQFTVIS